MKYIYPGFLISLALVLFSSICYIFYILIFTVVLVYNAPFYIFGLLTLLVINIILIDIYFHKGNEYD